MTSEVVICKQGKETQESQYTKINKQTNNSTTTIYDNINCMHRAHTNKLNTVKKEANWPVNKISTWINIIKKFQQHKN